MVADSITKEQAAKFIKRMRMNGNAPIRSAMAANILWILFDTIGEGDDADVELHEGEAEVLLTGPFSPEEFAAGEPGTVAGKQGDADD